MLMLEELQKRFDAKMIWLEMETGRNPKDNFLFAGGPEFADWSMKALFALYLSGVEDGRKGV